MPPPEVVKAMSARSFYETAATVMKRGNPPSPKDPDAIEFLQQRGISVGSDLRWWLLWPNQRIALRTAKQLGNLVVLSAAYFQTEEVNGWRGFPNTGNTIGKFGTNYDARAAVAKVGFGANIPEDAIYRSATIFNLWSDDYTITFSKSHGPP